MCSTSWSQVSCQLQPQHNSHLQPFSLQHNSHSQHNGQMLYNLQHNSHLQANSQTSIRPSASRKQDEFSNYNTAAMWQYIWSDSVFLDNWLQFCLVKKKIHTIKLLKWQGFRPVYLALPCSVQLKSCLQCANCGQQCSASVSDPDSHGSA